MTEYLLGPYIWAALSIAIMLLIYPFQQIIGDAAQDKMGRKAGTPIKGGHDDFAFRAFRAAGNSSENMPFLILLILLSVALAAPPMFTNILALLALASRLIHMTAYYANKGDIRGLSWLAGLLIMVVMSGNIIWALISRGSF